MNAKLRKLRREQLDEQLIPIKFAIPSSTPHGGWIRSIRESLGMSLQSFAQRLGLASSSTAHQLEQAEVNETITIKRLRAAADVLGCDLAVVLIPRISLAEMTEEQAKLKASARLHRVGHSMALEGQGVSEKRLTAMVREETNEILYRGDSKLWD